ncbi:MAG: aminoglycoside phosphotransferase, partial [Actinomycetota bacterium]
MTAAGARLLPVLLSGGFAAVALRTRFRVSAPAGTTTIESCLRDTCGPGISFGMHLGAARANRKPVLQLLTEAGRAAGFAKVSINPLTSEL